MAKGRLNSKTKQIIIIIKRTKKRLNKVMILKTIKQSNLFLGQVFQRCSKYCDFLYLVCVVGPMKSGSYYLSLWVLNMVEFAT